MEILISILNSNGFAGFATILTGSVAILTYFSQKKSNKIQAARVLLTEIRTAEEQIAIIDDKISSGNLSDLPTSVIKSGNWKKYAHLFISDFDQDELKLINSFYDHGELIENFARRNANYFWITTEERARTTVQTIAKFVTGSFENADPNKYVKDRLTEYGNGMDLYNTPYSPKVTVDRIKILLQKIEKITTSSAGIKLKKLSNLDK